MNTIDKFLKYVTIDTTSQEGSETYPSTLIQHNLAKELVQELEEMGAEEITYDKEHCYVYATIPATVENVPVIGFIAHMDTSPAVSGKEVKPRVIKNYDGKDIELNSEKKIILKVTDFPDILQYTGKNLIVTDGTTLLGADDKAGIAEIMAMAEYFLSHKDSKHGKIRIGFTPDEEIGCGTDFFDVGLFGAEYAYTVDGGRIGELEYENFNAANAKVIINGRSVHPGSAKGKMMNSILIGQELQSLLPVFDNPMYTEMYEGFFHLDSIEGNVETTKMDYIIRDHDKALFEHKKRIFQQAVSFLNDKYGQGTVDLKLKDSYYNMKEIVEPHFHLIDKVVECMKDLSIKPIITPIRGGTDGARLSFMGLPCPNICTGGENFHGKYEFACVESMELITELLIHLAGKFVK